MTRYFYHILFVVVLFSFMVGFIYSNGETIQPIVADKPTNHSKSGKITDDLTPYDVMFKDAQEPAIVGDKVLPSCSKVNTMPCDVSPPNPLKESLDSQVVNNYKLFKKDEAVTCIYNGIFWWDNRDEFVKAVPMRCKVIEASKAFNDLEPNYQHIKVNCLKDLETKWSDQPGAGMVKGHALNPIERWYSSSDCYHFTQID